jgi:hypothetical protein
MARRWKGCLGWSIFLFVVVGGIVVMYVPVLHWGLIGLYRGESFYRNRPTSYWRFQLESRWMDGENVDAEWELERGGTAALPVLMELFNDKEQRWRLRAAEILGRMGPAAKPAVPDLEAALLVADDLTEKVIISRALENIDPKPRPKDRPKP